MAKPKFHELMARDQDQGIALFYEWDHKRLRLRTRYAATVCSSCGKFDPRKAADLGFDEDVLADPPKLDFFGTDDLQYVISQVAANALKPIVGDELQTWPIGMLGWYYALPTKLVTAPSVAKLRAESAFRTFGKKCAKCQRFNELTLNQARVVVPEGSGLVGYWVEDIDLGCPNVAWACSASLLTKLLKLKIRGLKIDKDAFGSGSSRAATLEDRINDPKSELRRILDGDF